MMDFVGQQFPENLACYTCVHVLAGEPIVHFSFDNDGDLQFLCKRPTHQVGEGKLVALSEMIDQEPSLAALPEMTGGQRADRTPTSDWVVLG